MLIHTFTGPVIHSEISVVINEENTKTLGIKYTPTPALYVVFDRYRFQLSDPNIPVQEKLFNDTNRLVLFDNLVPGRLYDISIWTVSGGVNSIPIHRQTRLCKYESLIFMLDEYIYLNNWNRTNSEIQLLY